MNECIECKESISNHSISAIYIESKKGLRVDYFICKECLDIEKHFHNLKARSGWSHLYGDISSNQQEWMEWVVSKTRDTVCGKAGYLTLNATNNETRGIDSQFIKAINFI